MGIKKSTWLILAIGLSILASAFLAPVLYSLLPFFKFEKILNRLLMISAVLISFSFIRIRREFLDECGLLNHRSVFKELTIGFVISVLMLAGLLFFEIKLGALQWSDSFHFTLRLVFTSLLTGTVVGAFEEFFFRGFMFLNFKKRMPVFLALILTSAIYSSVHFLKAGQVFVDAHPSVWDSFRVLGASLLAFSGLSVNWPGFIGLFLFGLVLNFAFLRTRSLFVSIGLHAGAVFFLKVTRQLCQISPGFSPLIFGGKGFYSGLLGWVFIGFIGLLVHLLFPVKTPQKL